VWSTREHWSDTNAALREIQFSHRVGEAERRRLVAGLGHEHPAVRRRAATVVVQEPFLGALDALLTAALDPDKNVRQVAVQGLAAIARDPDGRARSAPGCALGTSGSGSRPPTR